MRIYMTRIDPEKNMKRFYELELTADLFGNWSCVRRWGRVGCKGRRLELIFATQDAAAQEADRWFLSKRARGYM